MLNLTYRRSVLVFVCLCSSIAFFDCQQIFATAESEIARFDVPGGKAKQTLKQAAQQAGLEIFFSASDVHGVTTPPVQGEFVPIEAFNLMLADTSLAIFQHEKSGVYTIREAATAEDANGDTQPQTQPLEQTDMKLEKNKWLKTLAALLTLGIAGDLSPVQAQENNDEDVEAVISLSPFEVDAQYHRGYRGIGATGVMRTANNLLDVPQTVNIINDELLEDLQAFSIGDSLYYTSNINRRLNTDDGFRIRGFRVLQLYRNGFEDQTATTKDSANISRVEIIKGANAITLLNADPGGSVNRITKKPIFDENLAQTTFTFGSNNLYRFHADVGSALNEEKTLAYRLNLAYTNWDHFQKHKGADEGQTDLPNEKIFVAPSIEWKINSKVKLLVDFEYQEQDRFKEIYTVGRATGDGGVVFPLDDVELNISQPWSFKNSEAYSVYSALDFKLLDNVHYRQSFGHGRAKYFEMFAQQRGAGLVDIDGDGVRNEMRRFNRFTDSWDDYHELQGDLLTNFYMSERVKNSVLINYNWRRGSGHSFGGRNFDVPPAFLDDPGTYFTIPAPNRHYLGEDQFPDKRFSNQSDSERFSYSIQDQVSLLDGKVIGVAGVRTDKISGDDGTTSAPRYGVLFQPKSDISAYYSFADSERAQSRTREDGVVLDDPITGSQHEVGIKTEFLNGKVSANLAYYEISRENLILGVLQPDGTQLLEHAGEQTSEGVELEISGMINDNWQLFLSTGTLDTTDKSTLTTRALRGSMDHRTSIWTLYDIVEGPLKGLSVGGGWVFNGPMVGDREASFYLPSADFGELRLSYDFSDRYKLSLNVKNITDEVWWEDSIHELFITPGTPRSFMLSLKADW